MNSTIHRKNSNTEQYNVTEQYRTHFTQQRKLEEGELIVNVWRDVRLALSSVRTIRVNYRILRQ
jgi:hypothetical protein